MRGLKYWCFESEAKRMLVRVVQRMDGRVFSCGRRTGRPGARDGGDEVGRRKTVGSGTAVLDRRISDTIIPSPPEEKRCENAI